VDASRRPKGAAGAGTKSPDPATRPDGGATPVVYDDEGVDRTLIRECLGRSPAERLEAADDAAREIEALRLRIRPGPLRS